MHLTYRYRVKSKIGRLNKMANAVNYVWNYCNDAQKHALKWRTKWPTGFDLMKMTAGTSKDLGISAQTINAICDQYDKSRRQHRKQYLRFRGRRTLGWIPLKREGLAVRDGRVIYYCEGHKLAWSRSLPEGAKIRDGSSFSQDARGRWYLNVSLEVPAPAQREIQSSVAIDLGLKALATLSTGEKIVGEKPYRSSAARVAAAQRARKRKTVRRIHTKIANRRKDFLHKASARIARSFDLIVVGNVSAKAMARSPMAKSVHDAGWAIFKDMLRYKAIAHGAEFREVDEAYSTQSCSNCGVVGGPRGREGLRIREWTCGDCGAVHDRDVNAARNILRAGHRTLDRGAMAA